MRVVDIEPGSVIVEKRQERPPGDLDGLIASIQDVGLLHPIVVGTDHKLKVGYRRLMAYKAMRRDTIPAHLTDDLNDVLRALKAERDENIQREALPPTVMVERARELEAQEREAARERQEATRTELGQQIGGENFPPPIENAGKTRDKVGDAFGVSGVTYEHAKAVVDAAEADPETFGDLPDLMDNKSIHRAHRELVKRQRQDAPPLPDDGSDEEEEERYCCNCKHHSSGSGTDDGWCSSWRQIVRWDGPDPLCGLEDYEPEEEEEPSPELSKPHVTHNSGNNEWYTPPEYISAARAVMKEIDLDPASSDKANGTVRADTYYTAQDDGLTHDWKGRVWMNPPYASEWIGQFCDKLAYHVQQGDVTEACILVNNATETVWFDTLLSVASAICLIKGRIKFIDADGKPSGAPLQGQIVLYVGAYTADFEREFSDFGRILYATWNHSEQRAGETIT